MFAAPTAHKDFTLLTELRELPWKEQLTFIDELERKLVDNPYPECIEICFLEMLQEKNVNVLQKMLKLIQTYIELFGIRNLSKRELCLALLNLSGGLHSAIDDMIALILLKS